MSAFLGPIHYWLYHKILVQEDMVQAILAVTKEEKQWNLALEQKLKEHCGEIERKSLEEMIDIGNIHGWLQEKVQIVERRLSHVVTMQKKKNITMEETIFEAIFELGKKYAGELEEFDSPKKVFDQLNNLLLDGMPCDHVNEVLESCEEEVVYRRKKCIHESFWIEANGEIADYYKIRKAFIDGLLYDTNYEFQMDDQGVYYIRRKG